MSDKQTELHKQLTELFTEPILTVEQRAILEGYEEKKA